MKIFLRPVTLDDGPQIVKWRNHKDVSNHCMNRNAISIESNRLFSKPMLLQANISSLLSKDSKKTTV